MKTKETECDNCGAPKREHGIDTNNIELKCPLYLKNDRANYDGNYHSWLKWKPKGD